MGRVRLFTIGPSTRTPRSTRITTSDIKLATRNGVIYRNPPGGAQQVTTKSPLKPKVFKGIRPPGYSPPNYPSPTN